jgi:formiminoglutamase
LPAWIAADSKLFFSKKDASDPRLGDLVQAFDGTVGDAVIAGYPDEEGIQINGGRTGAALAPSVIRKHFYKMTPPLFGSGDLKLFDYGDLTIVSDTASRETSTRNSGLPGRHESVRAAVREVLLKKGRWVGLGGGHDYGFSDGAGFMDVFAGQKPLVINFDAHLDVRPTASGFSSGTPFRRLLEEFKEFEFWEIGIQSQCNSRAHLDWVAGRGARVIGLDEIRTSGIKLVEHVVRKMGDSLLRPRPAYLSIDIDGFSSAYAPGCSQSFATGFEPAEFFELFDLLCRRLDVRVLGIYEVSPPLDQDDRTSKLAALILHRFLQSLT